MAAAKQQERGEARQLRVAGWSIKAIAEALGVSPASVSVWCSDIDPGVLRLSRVGRRARRPSALTVARTNQIELLRREGEARVGVLDERSFLVAGVMLYVAEGTKADGNVTMANTDPRVIAFWCGWLRSSFDIDESRLRARVYLHAGLDLDRAEEFWSVLTDIPRSQFHAAYRPPADPTRRRARHEHGCCYVRYSDVAVHRAIMGMADALLSSACLPG